MNQAQRKFLIDRIQAKIQEQEKIIKSQEPDAPPALENYLYGLALTGKLELRPTEEIVNAIRSMAMGHKAARYSENWLGNSNGDLLNRAKINMKITDLICIPEEYSQQWEAYNKQRAKQAEQIAQIKAAGEALQLRIQLASDKTLEQMISEVDDMGNISLMDDHLRRLLNTSATSNLIGKGEKP